MTTEMIPLVASVVENPCQSCGFPFTISVTISKDGGTSARRICALCGFPFSYLHDQTSPTLMLEVGVEGHLFNQHWYNVNCSTAGCVPFNEFLHVPGPHGTFIVRRVADV